MERMFVRFPNETEYSELWIEMDKFRIEFEFEKEIFGWYGNSYIAIKK